MARYQAWAAVVAHGLLIAIAITGGHVGALPSGLIDCVGALAAAASPASMNSAESRARWLRGLRTTGQAWQAIDSGWILPP